MPSREGANIEEEITTKTEMLDDQVLEEEMPGSMRIETQVIGGSNSAWDIQPMANRYATMNTTHRLIFRDAINNHTVMTLTGHGNVGIGTLAPLQKLHVHNGNILISATQGKSSSLLFNNGNTGSSNWGNYGIEYVMPNPIDGTPTGGLNFWRPFGSVGGFQNYVMFISDNGNVGIGNKNPTYSLDVCGKIRASQEIIVEANTWCDFVFDENYELELFSERIEKIKLQKHLPNVLPEKVIMEQGIPMSETMQGILQNVEELYLYMEKMENRILQLEEENRKLREEIQN